MVPAHDNILVVEHLSKTYGGAVALADVSLSIRVGEVHALCGENGAGKSTLIKILAGVVRADQGCLEVAGRPIELADVASSEAAGIAVMHQESTAFPDLDAVDNLFVGREMTRGGGWWLDRRAMERQTLALLDSLSTTIDVRRQLADLSLAQQQMVALARALLLNARLVIMDEPTASLSASETTVLMQVIRRLKASGVSVLYVSHRLEEVLSLADRVTVLRDGRHVITSPIAEVTNDRLIQWMVGRNVETPRQPAVAAAETSRPVVLHVSGLSRQREFEDISFEIRQGEIVGMAGLVGAGRSEVVRAIFGIDAYDRGQVVVDQIAIPPHSVQHAMRAGLALVPEDRQHQGLVLPMTVSENLTLALLPSLSRTGFLSRRRETELVDRWVEQLRVKTAGTAVPAATLSGGNQQKLVLGKWLARRPRLLMLDEPTRGIDVGAKAQVHRLIQQLADEGLGVLVISSELPELLTLCSRILIMRSGRLVSTVNARHVTAEELLELALPDGHSLNSAATLADTVDP